MKCGTILGQISVRLGIHQGNVGICLFRENVPRYTGFLSLGCTMISMEKRERGFRSLHSSKINKIKIETLY